MTTERPGLELPPTQQRVTVEIEYLDGTMDQIEAVGSINVTPGSPFLVIPVSATHLVGVSVASIRKWSAKASKLAVVGN